MAVYVGLFSKEIYGLTQSQISNHRDYTSMCETEIGQCDSCKYGFFFYAETTCTHVEFHVLK